MKKSRSWVVAEGNGTRLMKLDNAERPPGGTVSVTPDSEYVMAPLPTSQIGYWIRRWWPGVMGAAITAPTGARMYAPWMEPVPACRLRFRTTTTSIPYSTQSIVGVERAPPGGATRQLRKSEKGATPSQMTYVIASHVNVQSPGARVPKSSSPKICHWLAPTCVLSLTLKSYRSGPGVFDAKPTG